MLVVDAFALLGLAALLTSLSAGPGPFGGSPDRRIAPDAKRRYAVTHDPLSLRRAPADLGLGRRSACHRRARAIDGDSLMVSDQEVRLFGIDAPELMQTCTRNGEPWNCGQVAKDQLAKLIAGKQVVCVPVTVDRYRRTVARAPRARSS